MKFEEDGKMIKSTVAMSDLDIGDECLLFGSFPVRLISKKPYTFDTVEKGYDHQSFPANMIIIKIFKQFYRDMFDRLKIGQLFYFEGDLDKNICVRLNNNRYYDLRMSKESALMPKHMQDICIFCKQID
jgi:hypothetical protein